MLRLLLVLSLVVVTASKVFAAPASGKERAEAIVKQLKNPEPAKVVKESADVFQEKLKRDIRNPYQGGSDRVEENQKVDIDDILAGKNAARFALPLKQCINAQLVRPKCCVKPRELIFEQPRDTRRDLIGYNYPMLMAEVTENTYISRIMSAQQVTDGRDAIRARRDSEGAQMAQNGLKRIKQDAPAINQSEIDSLNRKLDTLFPTGFVNEQDRVATGQLTGHVVASKILFSEEYQRKFQKVAEVKQEDAFSKMSQVWDKRLSSKRPIGTDTWEGYEYGPEAYPERAARLKNPRTGPAKKTDPGRAWRDGGNEYPKIVKKIMLTSEQREENKKLTKPLEGSEQEKDMPNFPGKMFGIVPFGTSFNNKHWNVAWQMMVLAGLHPIHSPESREYPVFEVMPYTLTLKGLVGDRVLVMGGPLQEAKCYGVDKSGEFSDPEDFFKFEEEYSNPSEGKESGLIELHDINKLAAGAAIGGVAGAAAGGNRDQPYNMRRYLAFIYVQSCPKDDIINYRDSSCWLIPGPGSHVDLPIPILERYGSTVRLLEP